MKRLRMLVCICIKSFLRNSQTVLWYLFCLWTKLVRCFFLIPSLNQNWIFCWRYTIEFFYPCSQREIRRMILKRSFWCLATMERQNLYCNRACTLSWEFSSYTRPPKVYFRNWKRVNWQANSLMKGLREIQIFIHDLRFYFISRYRLRGHLIY